MPTDRATVMSATGSFDHRAIDGADGAALMQAFKRLCENPLAMMAERDSFQQKLKASFRDIDHRANQKTM